MRTLIDGYNLMYAGGLLGKRLGPDAFRRVRNRFLNDLAATLGPVDAHQTTVVFDASSAPAGVPGETSHKGVTVVYAVEDESADERIEIILGKHSHPRALTVVSTDRRVRDAATRRRATAVTSEQYWLDLDTRKERAGRRPVRVAAPASAVETSRDNVRLPADEAAFWLRAFGDIDEMPETREALSPESALLTDADIARIAREVDREFG